MPNARKAGYLPRSLVASLLFHALIISLQFGEPTNGLPWSAFSREAAPSIQAVLVAPAPALIAATELDMSTMSARISPRPRPEARQEKPAASPAPAPALTQAATVSLHQAREQPPEVAEPARPAVVHAAKLAPKENEILSTEAESTWAVPVTPQAREEDVRAEPAPAQEVRNILPKKTEELPQAVPASQEAAERKRVEQAKLEQAKLDQAKLDQAKLDQAKLDQAKLEQAKLEQAKLDQAKLDQAKLEQAKLEQAKLEQAKLDQAKLDQAKLDQAKLEQAKLEQAKLEQAKLEQAKLEQAKLEQAKLEQAKLDQAKAAAQKQAAAARQEALERARDAELARGRQESAGGAGQERAGRSESLGTSLARRALDQARSGFPGPPVNLRPEGEQRRRAGILGADPRNIQLAFYGEGWRQKVERIGSLNYPRVSKDRFYEPLVVTVSINSDGTLASLHIDKSSGQRDMDDAVRRIVEMSAPFSAFPPDLKRNYDVIDITRTWVFDERPRMVSQ